MHIKILVDYGQGYSAAMTATDARRLYEELKEIFEPQETIEKARERMVRDLQDKGFGVGFPGPVQCGGTTGFITGFPNAEALKAETSPETLRDGSTAPFFGTHCKCLNNEHGADCYPEVHS